MAYGVYSDRGYREHILERNKNTNKTEVFTQEDQTFTGRKTFLSGVTTSDLEVQTVEVSESIKVKGKDIAEIIDYLPNDVSKENKLTTKDFVNSSISTNTAHFLGTFNTLEEIESLTDVTNNDYAFWKTTDTLGNVVFKRYKYSADEQLWKFEYDLNNSSFTAAQWDAINSGITEELVSQIGQGGGSALVPSITQEQYNNLTEAEKNNGQIREITNTNPKKVMLNGMDLNEQLVDVPIGIIMQFGKNCPNGFVNCNGQSLSRTNYNRLFAIIGTTYGADNEDTFKVPLITDKALLNVEYMTGKRYIDGKPIYKKIIDVRNNGVGVKGFSINISDLNIDYLVNSNVLGSGNSNYSGNKWVMSCVTSSGTREVYLEGATQNLRGKSNEYMHFAILEYTKKTDTENTFCYNQLAGSNFCIKATDYTSNRRYT